MDESQELVVQHTYILSDPAADEIARVKREREARAAQLAAYASQRHNSEEYAAKCREERKARKADNYKKRKG